MSGPAQTPTEARELNGSGLRPENSTGMFFSSGFPQLVQRSRRNPGSERKFRPGSSCRTRSYPVSGSGRWETVEDVESSREHGDATRRKLAAALVLWYACESAYVCVCVCG